MTPMTPTPTATAVAADINPRLLADRWGKAHDLALLIDAAGVAALHEENERLREACELGRDAAAALFRAIDKAGVTSVVLDELEHAEGRRYHGFGVKLNAAISSKGTP